MFRFSSNPFGLPVCAALAFFLGASDPGTSRAEDPTVRTMSVSTRGIDIGSPAGILHLHQAIERAARQVCSGSGEPLATWGADYVRCHDNAVAGAMAQLQLMVARANPAMPKAALFADSGEAPH